MKKQVKTLSVFMQTVAKGSKKHHSAVLVTGWRTITRSFHVMVAASLFMGSGIALGVSTPVQAAACPAPSADYGTLTLQINAPGAATYKVWSRIMVPDATNNSINLQVDTSDCHTVGGGTIAANTWTWVSVNQTLTQGNHTFKYIGTKPGVSLDRVILTSNTNPTCVPTGTGDNALSGSCASDSTGPTVNIVSPTNNQSVSGTVNISATASDTGTGVKEVRFRVDGTVVGTDTSSPYSFSWNSANVSNGSRKLTAVAVDNADNSTTSAEVTVTVSGGGGTDKPGDVNGDGKANLADMSIIFTNWMKPNLTRAQGDLTGDGTANLADLSKLFTNWLP